MLVKQSLLQTSSLHLLIYSFAKRAGNGVPSPIKDNLQLSPIILFTFCSWAISQTSACVKQREEGWSACCRNNVPQWEPLLKSLVGKGNTALSAAIRWPLTYTSQNIFLLSIWFQKLKSSSTWHNPCFPLRRAFLLLLCWVSFPTPVYSPQANTSVNFGTRIVVC